MAHLVVPTLQFWMNSFHIWYWITGMSGCVAHNDLWPWPISSRLFSCDIAYFMDYIHMCHKYNSWGDNVSRTISRSIGQGSRSHRSFECLWSERGYSSRWLIYNFWLVLIDINKMVSTQLFSVLFYDDTSLFHTDTALEILIDNVTSER